MILRYTTEGLAGVKPLVQPHILYMVSSTIHLWFWTLGFSVARLLQPPVQLIAANLPPEIGRQLTNIYTVRFGIAQQICEMIVHFMIEA